MFLIVLKAMVSDNSNDNKLNLICNTFLFISVDDTTEDVRNDAEDHALLLATSHDDCVEIWHLGHVSGKVSYKSVATGATQITVFEEAVVDIAFSPDSTAVAVASLDGYVRFFLVISSH